MGHTGSGEASIQDFYFPNPNASPTKFSTFASSRPETPFGDGFSAEDACESLKTQLAEPWHPQVEYTECDICDLSPGPRAVTFMGRIANVFDVANTPKTPRSAQGCLKLCVKDDKGAVTVRLWYASPTLSIRIGSLVSIWTNHISNGENGNLSSASAPLFISLFPERDRCCHLMVHENSDDGTMLRRPLDYRRGHPLSGLMTLHHFLDGGCDVAEAKVLVIVKSIGAKKKVTRKDKTKVDNMNLQVHDDSAQATLGLWGTSALSPLNVEAQSTKLTTDTKAVLARRGWMPGETVLLLQAPGCKFGRSAYLSLTSTTIVDVDPLIADADWLRRWSIRRKSREAVNPPFPEGIFDLRIIESGPVRCLFTIADLDEFARAAPDETFQGYLSLIIVEIRLLDCWKRHQLLSGECCSLPVYANAITAPCQGCDEEVHLRLSPRILGQVVDETAAISPGKLLFSDRAWQDMLGRSPDDLLKMGYEELKELSDHLLFRRLTTLFGWTGDESKAGGRICVLGVRS